MTEKTEESQFSDETGKLDLEELRSLDSQNVTLAQAIEQAQLAMETTLTIKGEIVDEIERFRAAMRRELKGSRLKPDLVRDIFAFLGLGSAAFGIAIAFHWSYSLIVVGFTLFALSLIPLLGQKGSGEA